MTSEHLDDYIIYVPKEMFNSPNEALSKVGLFMKFNEVLFEKLLMLLADNHTCSHYTNTYSFTSSSPRKRLFVSVLGTESFGLFSCTIKEKV